MRCTDFQFLANNMIDNNIDKEHYDFVYNDFRFDVIFSIALQGYEILVAIHTYNLGCVLKMDENYFVEMPNNDYFALCRILNLNWNKNHFNSSAFLRLLSENAPRQSNRQGVSYIELRDYLRLIHICYSLCIIDHNKIIPLQFQ